MLTHMMKNLPAPRLVTQHSRKLLPGTQPWNQAPGKSSLYFVFSVFLLCIALTACTPARQPMPDIRLYTLEYPSPVLTGPRAQAVLHVARFGAAPEYRTPKIIYRDQSFVRQEYTYHQWRATPQVLAADFMRRDLQASGLFIAVNPPSSLIPATHEIEGMVEQWLEEDGPEQWMATLELTITLVNARASASPDMVLFQRTYRHSQPCAKKILLQWLRL